jgi:hypothetical protein
VCVSVCVCVYIIVYTTITPAAAQTGDDALAKAAAFFFSFLSSARAHTLPPFLLNTSEGEGVCVGPHILVA